MHPSNDHPELRRELAALLPRLRRFARALTAGSDEADDLVQAACERALPRLGQFEAGTRLDSWMFRLMQNLWIDWQRARQARPDGHLDAGEDLLAAVPGVDGRTVTEQRLSLQQVLRALGELPDEQRAVMALVCVEDHSYQEAAQALDIPVGTVMSRLARARLRLTRMLGGQP